MYHAYTVQPIVDNLPLKIQAIDTADDRFYIGTADGSLLVYGVEEEPSFEVTLLDAKKGFSKKPIDLLGIAPSAGNLIVISDGQVTIHSLEDLSIYTPIPKAKGATLFAVWSYMAEAIPHESEVSDTPPPLVAKTADLLCLSVKKKLLLYNLESDGMAEIKEINLPDRPQSVLWLAPERIVVALQKGFFSVDVNTGLTKELIAKGQSLMQSLAPVVGRMEKPMLARVGYDKVLVGRDESSVVVNMKGEVAHETGISWSTMPTCVLHAPPYLVGLTTNHVQVRSLRTKEIVQSINLPSVHTMVPGPTILVASNTSIWRLLPLDFEDQIEQLISANQYLDAQALIEDLEFPTEEDKIANIVRVRGLYAHHIFTAERKYEEAVNILEELKASPIDVINLYPDLMGQKDYVGPPSERKALLVLMDYLTSQRAVLGKYRQEFEHAGFTPPEILPEEHEGLQSFPDAMSDPSAVWPPIAELTAVLKQHEDNPDYASYIETLYLSRLVDTTLLKVYLSVNDALVGIFLRVPNQCELNESEKLLLLYKKYNELIDLYRGKGLHRKALDFISQKPDLLKSAVQQLVTYLQRLAVGDLDLVIEYSSWALEQNPALGIKIFTEQYDEIDFETRQRITDHLQHISSDLSTLYLEHLIHELRDPSPDFHDRLIHNYLADIKNRANEGSLLDPIPHSSQSESELVEFRRKLHTFLESSTHYRADIILKQLPDGLWEERCVLLSRLKWHEEALNIHIYKLQNSNMAEQYCQRHFSRDDPLSQSVYLILLKLYLALLADGMLDLPFIVGFMSRYGSYLDLLESLDAAPKGLTVSDLGQFFEKSLHQLHRSWHMDEVVKNLLLAQRLQVHEKLLYYQSRRVVITEENMCSKCLKRIGNSVFACLPDGTVLHAYCAKGRETTDGDRTAVAANPRSL
ncbi:CNH domain-containing protein [Cladochytrium replicatum]|nr:CNH domain-containing protein [Cladochytrium replicatum]